MATVTKTRTGKWQAIIRRTGWPQITKTFRIKRDAENWARGIEDEMLRGAYVQRTAAEKMTIADALQRYWEEIVPLKKPSTQLRERARFREIGQFFGKYSLTTVTPNLVAKYRDQRLAAGKANNTVRLELALLSHLYTIAIKEWHLGLTSNPALCIRKPSPGRGRERRIEPDEKQRLLAAVNAHSNPMLGWIVGIALETGMRRTEIVSLTLDQLELKQRIVLLPDTKNNTPRIVPLNRKATELFKAALNNPLRPGDTDLIFFGNPGRDGQRRPYQYDPIWQDIKKQQGIENLHFHDMRHEAISRLVESGLSDQSVSAISGHKSMQMLKRYSHLRAKTLVAQLDAIDDEEQE